MRHTVPSIGKADTIMHASIITQTVGENPKTGQLVLPLKAVPPEKPSSRNEPQTRSLNGF